MKPEPMNEISMSAALAKVMHDTTGPLPLVEFAQAIIAARDRQWADLIDTWTVECVTAEVPEPAAALVEVRRTDGPWQRYNVYDSVSLAEDTKARTNGGGIEVRVVPLYTAAGAKEKAA